MGQIETHLKIENHTDKTIGIHFRSLDKFDYWGDLYTFGLLQNRDILPEQEVSGKVGINPLANGVMFTLDLHIGEDKVCLRMDQKIALKPANLTKLDFKEKFFDNQMVLARIVGNDLYGCTGCVDKYDLRAETRDNRTIVIKIASNSNSSSFENCLR